VPDRLARLSQLLAQQRQVVVAVGQIGIAAQCALVGFHCFATAIQIVEQNAEIVQERGVAAAACIDGIAVDTLRLRELSRFVQQGTEIDIGIDERGVGSDRALVGLARRLPRPSQWDRNSIFVLALSID
jgi:hypothetical protein